MRERIRKLGIKGRNIYQGCGVGGSGDIKYQVWQTGYNGDWMADLSPIDNGGFEPIMNEKAKELVERVASEHDKDKIKAIGKRYAQAEDSWAKS